MSHVKGEVALFFVPEGLLIFRNHLVQLVWFWTIEDRPNPSNMTNSFDGESIN